MSKSRKKKSLNKQDFLKSGVELTSKQNKLYKGIRNNILSVTHGPAGTSKAQPIDTPILTPNGWVVMGDIKVGDEVISQDGNPTKVTGVFPQGEKEIWELTFSDNTKTECCDEHLWLTKTNKDRTYNKWFNNKKGTVKKTSDIVRTLFTENKKINHSIPITKPVNFKETPLPIKPYLLGCFIAEGCLKKSISCSSMNSETIENMKKISNFKETNKFITEEQKDYLKNNNLFCIIHNKTFIPDIYKYNSIENRIELLRGLMDVEGGFNSNNNVYFTSISEQLIKDVKELIRSLGGLALDYIPQQKHLIYDKIKIFNNKIHFISIKFESNINPFKIKPKKNKYANIKPQKIFKYITNAKLIGKKQAQCIKVDSESSLYLTNDYIVTHNTFTSCYASLGLLADKKVDKIIITKPIQESGENLGFLPGDMNDKLHPYKQSYYTNFIKIIGKEITDNLFENDEIIFEPLAYMRGSTYDNCVMLLDEAQNASIKQLMLWITRLGNDSKAIMMGDTSQYDVRKRDSGYIDFMNMISDLDNMFEFQFSNEDIVRNKFLIELTNRYDKYRNDKNI